jgi:hypothetical protein
MDGAVGLFHGAGHWHAGGGAGIRSEEKRARRGLRQAAPPKSQTLHFLRQTGRARQWAELKTPNGFCFRVRISTQERQINKCDCNNSITK